MKLRTSTNIVSWFAVTTAAHSSYDATLEMLGDKWGVFVWIIGTIILIAILAKAIETIIRELRTNVEVTVTKHVDTSRPNRYN